MILITGANGQLGQDFQKLFTKLNIEYIATDHKELDITSKINVETFVKNKNFTHIINCAAYNNVDKAEIEKDLCYQLNTIAPNMLAEIANKIDAIYVTYSSDFVFGENKTIPYIETDEVSPLSIYGKTKAQGEKLVLTTHNKSYIIRTSWVFGVGNNNFNKQLINWSRNKEKLSIVDDQISSPTYSYDLALFSWKLIQTNKYGLYHITNSGEASKFDQAKYLLNSIGWKGSLERANTSDFNLAAKRSKYSKLSNEKIEKTLGVKMPAWQDGIDRFLKEFNY